MLKVSPPTTSKTITCILLYVMCVTIGYLFAGITLDLFINKAKAQSYDVSDNTPPEYHAERTPYYVSSPVFRGKYTLLIDLDCESQEIIINVRVRGGSIPLDIKVNRDTVHISLMATSFGEIKNITSDVVIPNVFDLFVTMEKDVAEYHVEFDVSDKSLRVKKIKESWFIELERILEIPKNVFWIHRTDGISSRLIRKIKKKLNDEGFKYEILDEGYYRCFPPGYIMLDGKKNQTKFGRVLFFRFDNGDSYSFNMISKIVEDCAKGKIISLGFSKL